MKNYSEIMAKVKETELGIKELRVLSKIFCTEYVE